MEERPKLKVENTIADKMIEIVGWFLLIAVWVLVIKNYAPLPDTIPIHFNSVGQADGFGGKVSILVLPFFATIVFFGLTALNTVPHIFNYSTDITQDNALRQYTNATRLIRYLKTSVVFIFGHIVLKTIQNASGVANGLGVWFSPLTMILTFVPITYFVMKSLKAK